MSEQKPFKLEPLESSSALWMKLAEYLAERRDVYRKTHEGNLKLDDKTVLIMRTRIAMCDELIRLGEPAEPFNQ